ncbi:PQ-loop-domain-containing protein [Delitschia confertaspora ATCC 74209]|uniref:PQ-loop-domain-containing protein n=1 Tax=Delitschia confertaspora ATCC 74209 TaxID=1513339 RepID=A0A9P4JND7_9PLEO|nr:PQ-loop-domain-containing protein [Delitschia confertaspora ATCC 74209]
MFPPSQGLTLDIDAISQICGSVSIACWIVVFSPQIIENWRRGSADGLSIVFIVVWLLGDLFNILGAVMQGVLPTMIILAVYYTFADIVLMFQVFYYKGFTLSDEPTKRPVEEEPESSAGLSNERSPLLHRPEIGTANGNPTNGHTNGHSVRPQIGDIDRQHSHSSLRERLLSVDGTHLSPATPFISDSHHSSTPQTPPPPPSVLQTILFNLGAVVLVCASGVLGWYLSTRSSQHSSSPPPESDSRGAPLQFNLWGQIFGYICAALYLGSRIPQLLLNYRRKSTEGISMLFFLFACIGNLTYVLSILAYKPVCGGYGGCGEGEAGRVYGKYIAVNLSWLVGSFGTLVLDAGVFWQYFLYKGEDGEVEEGSVVAVLDRA